MLITKLQYGNTKTYFVRGKNGGLLVGTVDTVSILGD